jgi:hypothetical protein
MSGSRFCTNKLSHGRLLTLAFLLALTGAAEADPSIAAGSSVTVSVSSGPGNKGDWIGLFRVGAPSDGFDTLAWAFLSGTQTYPDTGMSMAKFKFVLPPHLSPGQYEFRFYASDNYFTLLATGNSFTVGSGGSGMPKISTTPTQAASSETISVSGGPGGANDWVGLYRVGAPSDNEHLLAWGYLNGTQKTPSTGASSGSFNFVMPSNLSNMSAGLYEFRFYANDDFKEPLAISQPIKLGSGPQLHSAP